MPFNGSGVFGPIPAPDYPAVAETLIRAAQFNANLTDIFNGLTNCVTRNGQSPATANLPMGGFKHTGVANAVAADQYATLGQVVGSTNLVTGVGGTTTAYTGNVTGVTAYAAGQYFWFTPNVTNTGASTLNINGLGAKTIHKRGGTDVASGQLFAGVPFLLYYTGSQFRILGDGGTVLAPVPGSSSGPSINLPHGTAPSSPNNGDIWTTSAGLFGHISGATKTFAALEDTNTFTANQSIITSSAGLAIEATSGLATCSVSAVAGTVSRFVLRTETSARWIMEKSVTAESGSNVGSDFNLNRYNDAGSLIGVVFGVKRSTGNVIINGAASSDDGVNKLQVTGSAIFTGTVKGPAATTSLASFQAPHGTAPTSPNNGDIWSTTGGLFGRVNGVTQQYLGTFAGSIVITAGTPALYASSSGAAGWTVTDSGTGRTTINHNLGLADTENLIIQVTVVNSATTDSMSIEIDTKTANSFQIATKDEANVYKDKNFHFTCTRIGA